MKKNKIILLLIGLLIFIPVNAETTIDYKMSISENLDFDEEIKYQISNYQRVENGFDESMMIIYDDVYADIDGTIKYRKASKLENNIYYITLNHSFNEKNITKAKNLNNCFDNVRYRNEKGKITYSGTGYFKCMEANNMTISIVTDLKVNSNNADSVNGNTYTWKPKDNNFNLNIELEIEEYIEETKKVDSVVVYVFYGVVLLVLAFIFIKAVIAYKKNNL